ncbi:hypothetical protein MferCBS31731_003609 [Microsporum ferrugineum]
MIAPKNGPFMPWWMALLIIISLNAQSTLAWTNNPYFPGTRLPPSMRSKGRLSQNFHDCEEHQDAIKKSYTDAYYAVGTALKRLNALQSFLQTRPAVDTVIKGIDRSTLYTFETLFGNLYNGPSKGYPEGYKRLKILFEFDGSKNIRIERLTRLDRYYHSYRWEIWCSENFLAPLPQDMIPTDKGDAYISKLYFDDRPEGLGGQRRIYCPLRCGGKSNVRAMTLHFSATQSPSGSYDIVVLCPWYFDNWFGGDDTLNSPLDGLRQHQFDDKSVHLDMISRKTLALTLIHEITHSLKLFPYPMRATRDFGYYFDQITKLAQEDPDDAIYNADNTAYFVIDEAMRMDMYDWSEGFNKPMYADTPFDSAPE